MPASAALVIEVVAPDDDSCRKLPFYAKHGVAEALLADPAERRVDWLLRLQSDGEHSPIDRSSLLDLGPAELGEQIDWP